LAEGRRLSIETIQHHLPAAIHGRGLNDLVIRDLGIGLEQGRQRQLGRRHQGMPLRLVFIERCQFLLKSIGEQRMAVLPQEDKQLGTADAPDDSVFRL
jgi:hypothetical protein